jgi:SpoVK/Ycf46/Vps4 family AAA+-type ATPase
LIIEYGEVLYEERYLSAFNFERRDIMGKVYFKVSLRINFRKDINLEERWQGIKKAAEQFTREFNNKRQVIPVSVKDNMLQLAVAITTEKGHVHNLLRLISSFLKNVCSIFQIQYDSKKRYFTVDEILEIDFEEFMAHSVKNYTEGEGSAAREEEGREEEVADTAAKDYGFKVPKRKFPQLSSGSVRAGSEDKKEVEKYGSYKEVLKSLDNMIGLEDIKRKINELASFIIRNNERYVRLNIENPGLYYNIAISGGKGTGKDTIAKLIYHLFLHLGVIGSGKFICVDTKELWPGSVLDRIIGTAQSGCLYLNDVHCIDVNDRRGQKDYPSTFGNWFTEYKKNFVFILSGEQEGMRSLMKQERIKKHMNFEFHLPDYSNEEMLKLVCHFAEKERFTISPDAEETILKSIEYYKSKGIFENVYTAQDIVEKAIIKNGLKERAAVLQPADFLSRELILCKEAKVKAVEEEQDPFKELEDMIGLSEVKKRVKEIAAYAAAQQRRKELGLDKEPICLHMSFTGAPGTGKTTVARCIGRILKKLGVLSKGNFVEVSRESLVGRYVGHTAVKTAEKIKEAEGGILFIDECYLLSSESKVDYGYEAVGTIVKKMEDMRDNLIIIFAGYQKEMEEFMSMNPGLRSRVQFNVDFADYSEEELLRIWEKFFYDSNYTIEEEAVYEMSKITQLLYENRSSDTANGRIARKCFERAKIHQAVRLMDKKVVALEDITRIMAEDVRCLYNDADLMGNLRRRPQKKCIGFI